MIVEDAAELGRDHPHVVRLEARPANVEGAGEVTLRDLVRQSLRMRPDRLVVGEVRGAEVRRPAGGPQHRPRGRLRHPARQPSADVPARFEALGALAGLGPAAVHAQLLSAVRVVVHVRRAGQRRFVDTVGVLGRDESGVLQVVPALRHLAGGGTRRQPGWASLAALLHLDAGALP